jgi:hypothetical protein
VWSVVPAVSRISALALFPFPSLIVTVSGTLLAP